MLTLGFTKSFADDAGNAIGVMGSGEKMIVLLGHIDTVPGEISVQTEDGILYGRGSVDAKGPLACFVDAVARIGLVPGWQFIVIGAVEEERNSEGARHVVDLYKPDFAVIGEPNRWDRIALGYKGSALAEVRVEKDQFHSAHSAESASETVVAHWNKIRTFADTFNIGRSKAFEKLLLNLDEITSGKDAFKQWAQINVGARLPLDLSPHDWYEILTNTCEGAIVRQKGYPISAWACEKNTVLVRAMTSTIRTHGGTPNFVYKTGTADLNIVAPVWGCPTVVYGPGDSVLDHTPSEHIALEEYEKAVKVLAGALYTLVTIAKHAV
jgi:LysW-gamma-L-lysine carboxypeptidase